MHFDFITFMGHFKVTHKLSLEKEILILRNMKKLKVNYLMRYDQFICIVLFVLSQVFISFVYFVCIFCDCY